MINIDKIKSTVFKCSLEECIDSSKNNIYSITLLIAWKEVQTILKTNDLVVDNENFSKLNSYKLDHLPLDSSEFKKVVTEDDDTIKIEVNFKKLLPFSTPIRINDSPLIFNDKKISSFSPNKFTEIIYFKNEDDFAIKLNFKDEENEMILIKTKFDNSKSLKYYLPQTYEKNYIALYPDDIIEIPEIQFDLESNFENTVPFSIKNYSDKREASIEKIHQQVSFTLDNKGASIKSKTKITMEKWNCVFPKKKLLIFNKPFAVYLKKKNNTEPYFASLFATSDYFKEFTLK